jgi:NADH-quinone oxidoreductase subunit G
MSFDFNYRTNSENIVAPDRTVVILAEVLKSIATLTWNKVCHFSRY